MRFLLSLFLSFLLVQPSFAQSGYANGAGYDNGIRLNAGSNTQNLTPNGVNDNVQLQAAIDSAALICGTVNLGAGIYILAAAVTIKSCVTLLGKPPGLTFGDAPGNDYFTFDGTGTIIDGNSGGFDCFAANTTSQAIGSWNPQQSIVGVNISGMGFRNCQDGIHIGAQNYPGLYYSRLSNLFFTTNAGWGLHLANPSLNLIEHVNSVSNTTGDFLTEATVRQSTYIPGNTTFVNIYSSPLNNLARGIVFQAQGADSNTQCNLNSIKIYDAQTNRYRDSLTTQTITPSNGSTSVSVTDLSKFAVNMPFWVTATLDGYTANILYFVASVSGTSGAGTITAATAPGATPITASAGTALTLNTYGFPALEMLGNLGTSGGASAVQGHLFGLDLEGSSSTLLLEVNGKQNTYSFANTFQSSSPTVVALRTSLHPQFLGNAPLLTSMDYDSTSDPNIDGQGKKQVPFLLAGTGSNDAASFNGYVGIGTVLSATAIPLFIAGPQGTHTPQIKVENSSSGGATILLQSDGSFVGANIQFKSPQETATIGDRVNGDTGFQIAPTGTNEFNLTATQLGIGGKTQNGGTQVLNSTFTITGMTQGTAQGNVGIGTWLPGATLDVEGTLVTQNIVMFANSGKPGNVGIQVATPGMPLDVSGTIRGTSFASGANIGVSGTGATSCLCKTYTGGICTVIGTCT